MDTIKIDTTQNISIEQPIASVGERITATLLDYFFLFCYSIVLMLIYSGIKSNTFIMLGSIPALLYSLISELTMNGQTWGKIIMKIKVIKMDGTTTTFSSYFLRWIVGIVEIIAFFGSLALITIILNRKGQRLGDIAANTTVIRLKEKSLNSGIFIRVPDNYSVVFPETAKLSAHDIDTLQEVLEILKSHDSNVDKLSIARKTRAAFEQKLNIKTKQNTIPFFETLILDYNYLNSREM